MHTFFFVCFGVGVGYAVVSFMLGELLGAIHFDSDMDFDVDSGSGSASVLKPVVIAAFLTVFGGTGILLYNSYTLLVTFTLAGLLGLFVAFCFHRFIITPLYKMQNTSAVEKQSLIGLTAKVTEYIPQGKFGKITYITAGNTYSAPAKSEDGTEIERHSQVEIIHINKNVFYVRKVNEAAKPN